MPEIPLRECSDERLVGLLREADADARAIAARKPRIAAEIARRSAVTAGHTGLAARLGERSPERLIQRLTGASAAEARQLTATGALLEAVAAGSAPWLAPIATAVERGGLSVGSAAAVANGLGAPSEPEDSARFAGAAHELVAFAAVATPEEAATRTRAMRDELDVAEVADRERRLRARRSMTWRSQDDGSTRAVLVLDPESAAIVLPTIEAAAAVAATRSEVRFMTDAERAAAADGPTRTVDQARLDAMVDLVQLAVRAAGSELDDERILHDRTPGVRVHVRAEDLAAGVGIGHLDGQTATVGIETVTRLICSSGILPVLFDGWRIARDPAGITWLEPPPGSGVARRALESRSPLHRAA